MAYVNTTRFVGKGAFDRFLGLKDAVVAAVQRRRIYARTVAELNSLSDRELSDLGIARALIREISHEAAYGK